MANIIKILKDKLGDNFHVIDENDPNQLNTRKPEETNYLNQATVSIILAGLYEYITQNEYAQLPEGEDELNLMLQYHLPEIKSIISRYAGVSEEVAGSNLRRTYQLIRHALAQEFGNDPNKIKDAFTSQKEEILSYLPGSLGIGEILQHDTLDDRGHKMDGILSSFTKMLGRWFDTRSKSQLSQ